MCALVLVHAHGNFKGRNNQLQPKGLKKCQQKQEDDWWSLTGSETERDVLRRD